MKYDSNYYYLTDEEIADMRYESKEDLARKAVLGFATFVVFGMSILGAMLTLLGHNEKQHASF